MEKWEWDTFEAINKTRVAHNIKPLGWCCGLESNIRKSCGDKIFMPIPIKSKIVKKNCKHWTPPNEIARLVCENKILLNGNYKSGVLVIINDNNKTHVIVGLGLSEAISWENLCNNYPEIPKPTGYKEYNYDCTVTCVHCGQKVVLRDAVSPSNKNALYICSCGYPIGIPMD
jgi:hypothetical protein